tara:strand:- start:546 stop:1367 length:822 start_codon:yes stop_codon:yes gene_type:complete
MKLPTIINFLVLYLSGVSFIQMRQIYSSSTILNCSGDIPNGVPCIIKASSYKVEVDRIDICKNNPFINIRSTPDYGGSFCLNLFNKKNNSKKINLSNNPIFKIPENQNIKGEFKYISVIFKNKFTVSGKYKSGKDIWITNNKGPKNIIKLASDKDIPKKFSEKLTNWRGSDNKDNKYCDNNGGTSSRCDLNYNGNKLTAIGLNKDYIESFGDKVKFVFYNLELSPPIKIVEGDKGFINIRYKKNLEVYGNGKDVKSISTAPIIFSARFNKEGL